MTKSAALIIGHEPDRMLERHRQVYGHALEDVTEILANMVDGITERMPRRSAIEQAAQQLFAGGPYWIYDEGEPAPKQRIIHNHIISQGGNIVAAFRTYDDPDSLDLPSDYWSNNPFDYWFTPDIAYLPLRAATSTDPYHPITLTSEDAPYYAGHASSNQAAFADIDIAPIVRARRETTDDLLAIAADVLRIAGLDPAYDWQPRYRHGGWKAVENPDYARQDKVAVLLEMLPEHATRLDYLLLDRADLDLFSDWAMLPFGNLLTRDGLFSTNMRPDDADRAALFYQITQTDRRLLMALRDAWQSAAPDELFSVIMVHE